MASGERLGCLRKRQLPVLCWSGRLEQRTGAAAVQGQMPDSVRQYPPKREGPKATWRPLSSNRLRAVATSSGGSSNAKVTPGCVRDSPLGSLVRDTPSCGTSVARKICSLSELPLKRISSGMSPGRPHTRSKHKAVVRGSCSDTAADCVASGLESTLDSASL